MARQRDYKAEYRARVERGRKAGLTRAQAAGHAKRAKVPSITDLRARGVIPARPAAGRGKPLRDVKTPGGERLAQTGDQRVVKQLVRDALAAGQKVTIRGRYRTDAGEWRTATLDGTGQQGELLATAQRVGGAGGYPRQAASGRKFGALRTGGRPAVEVRSSTTGMDPAELLDFLDLYDSVWDALTDLFDATEYG